jgi:PAS domain-containing protein
MSSISQERKASSSGFSEIEKKKKSYISTVVRKTSQMSTDSSMNKDIENVITGSLKVQMKSMFAKWKTFYFELDKDTLYKFSKEGDERPMDVLIMNDFTIVDFDSVTGKKNTFAIFPSDTEQLVLMSNTLEEKEKWMKTLEKLSSKKTTSQRSVLDSLNDAGVSTDEKGDICSVNDKALSLFGYKRDELIGKNVTLLMPSGIAALHDGFLVCSSSCLIFRKNTCPLGRNH